jgi:hypothetical protein
VPLALCLIISLPSELLRVQAERGTVAGDRIRIVVVFPNIIAAPRRHGGEIFLTVTAETRRGVEMNSLAFCAAPDTVAVTRQLEIERIRPEYPPGILFPNDFSDSLLEGSKI